MVKWYSQTKYRHLVDFRFLILRKIGHWEGSIRWVYAILKNRFDLDGVWHDGLDQMDRMRLSIFITVWKEKKNVCDQGGSVNKKAVGIGWN